MKELIYHRQFMPAINTFGTKVAVIDGAYEASFEAHGDRVLRLASAMGRELGIAPGDRFAVMAVNCHEYLELYHAAYLGAGIINPLNLRLAGKELEYIVRDSGTEVVFVDAHFAQVFHDAMGPEGRKDVDNPIRRVVLIGSGDGPCDLRYEDLIAAGDAVVPPEPEEQDPVVLMYTGGTTGLPKGVLVTQRAEILNCYHAGLALGRFKPSEVGLLQTPIFHAASMVSLLATTGAGGTQVLLPMFEPAEVIRLIERHQVTLTMMVPTMIAMMVNHPDFSPERVASLESLTYGASPMPATLLDRLLEMLPRLELNQGYGMTESSSVLTFNGPDHHRLDDPRLRSVGRPVPGVELSIQNDAGEILPVGETGEVCAKGGNLMTEYWHKPEATAEAFQGGWYHTGDAGYLDDEGFLFLVDRVKDMIISGGENVYSVEVENAISSHAAVDQVAVIGIPHQLWGEQVHAVVVPAAGATVTEAEIIEHARGTIAGYKVPKSVEFRDEPLPLSGAMKVLKRELREPYWKDQDVNI
ncbi:MAG: AMP-binding protein [Gammaproteobacteria bacterium]|nr:AMP-binding protein [Gammaproteobacteria bacterium]